MFVSSGVINILDNRNRSIGTGFFISSEGIILTCLHVLTEAKYRVGDQVKYRYSYNDTIYKAEWRDDSTNLNYDIAILRSDVSVECYYHFSSSVGYEGIIESFGYPNGKKNGIYAKAEVYASIATPAGILQTQLGNANDITHGFSGAPVINGFGNVIGMVSDIPKKDENNRLANIAFAIPSSIILDLFRKHFFINVSSNEINMEENAINLIGRKSEILYYSNLINSNNVTVIQGMAGVGKTTLAVYLFKTVVHSPKLWITIRQDINNELETVLYDISDYLARNGCMKPINMFNDLKNSSQPYKIAILNLQNEIIKCILDQNLSIFIDDAHLVNSNSAVISFFSSLLCTCVNNKFVFITRHSLDFISQIKDFEPLRGLIKEDCKEFIKKSGLRLTDAHINDIYKKTQGNAKFLEVCIFSLLESDGKSIDDIINNLSTDFNLTKYIQTNIMDQFTDVELRILNIIALCRKPISFELLVNLSYGQFETIYYLMDKLVRRNIIEKISDNMYSMHALLKEQFARLSTIDAQLLHRQIAENLESKDYMEISYHYASCGRLNKALSILISKFEELIGSGSGALMYRQILSYRQLIQSDEAAQYYFLLGRLLVARGQYNLAIDALKKIPSESSKKLIFDSYIQLSQCYEKKGDYANALQSLATAEHIIRKSDKYEFALVDINKGFLLCHQEKISKGIKLCERGLQFLGSQHEISRNLIADGYSYLGWNYTIKGNYTKAVSALNRSIELYLDSARGVALAKIRLARIYWQKGMLDRALEEINQAESLSNLTGDPQLQAFALRQKNLILWCFGEFNISLIGHKEALKKYSKIKDYWGIAASLENISAILYDLGDYKSALIYINNAIKVCNKIGATDFLAYAFLYKSRILTGQGELVEAKKYAKSSISLLTKWKYSGYYLGMAHISLGIVYFEMKKFKISYIIFTIANVILSKGCAFFQRHIADFYKGLCLIEISKNKRKIDSILLECYKYFESIGAVKFVSYLKTIEDQLRRN